MRFETCSFELATDPLLAKNRITTQSVDPGFRMGATYWLSWTPGQARYDSGKIEFKIIVK